MFDEMLRDEDDMAYAEDIIQKTLGSMYAGEFVSSSFTYEIDQDLKRDLTPYVSNLSSSALSDL